MKHDIKKLITGAFHRKIDSKIFKTTHSVGSVIKRFNLLYTDLIYILVSELAGYFNEMFRNVLIRLVAFDWVWCLSVGLLNFPEV